MRIQILADVGDGIMLPVNYNHLLAGVIYRFLSESDPRIRILPPQRRLCCSRETAETLHLLTTHGGT